MAASALSRALRRRTTWIFLITLFFLISYIPSPLSTFSPFATTYYDGLSKFYASSAPVLFAPNHPSAHDVAGAKKSLYLCAGFPINLLWDIQISVRTNQRVSGRTRANLETVSSCVQNVLLYSDHEEDFGKLKITKDILADLPSAYRDHEDWRKYEALRADKERTAGTEPLDRWMFLPMVEHAFRERPQAKWFVFIEADTFVVWDTLFRLLDSLDPDKVHYIGHPVKGSFDRTYAMMGDGFILSKGAFNEMFNPDQPKPSLAEEFAETATTEKDGDAILGYAIQERIGKKLEGLYPTFSGAELSRLRIDEKNWCVPLMSFHGVTTPELLKSIWWWERTRTHTKRTFVHSTLLSYTHAKLRKEGTSTQEHWENFSDIDQPEGSEANKGPGECENACKGDEDCFQWSFNKGQCRTCHAIMMGEASRGENADMISGWNTGKMKELGWSPQEGWVDSCRVATWIRPNHWD